MRSPGIFIEGTEGMKEGITFGRGILWVLVWFGFMLLYTALDVVLWRNLPFVYGKYMNLFSIILCMAVFLVLLTRKNQYQINFSADISFHGILLALGCVILFYFLLDKGLDPVFEKFFPVSEAEYEQSLQALSTTPVISLLQVCVLSPLIEEIIMRDFLLHGLSVNYGKRIALLVSALLFAFLHFNMVQTLSAFICGIVLGLLYLYTGSLFCCIIAHAGYNLISYITMIIPLYIKV